MKSYCIRVLLVCMIFILVTSGCCRVVCSCNPLARSIELLYQNDQSQCDDGLQSLTQVATYDAESGQLITENSEVYRSDCIISIPYQYNKFWVVFSDSLNISDTIKVMDIAFREDSDKCCDCPTLISSVEINVNGNTFLDNEIELSY